MLTRTFCHIPGIGRETELALWKQGCDSWEMYLSDPDRFTTGAAAQSTVIGELVASIRAHKARDRAYFRKMLGSSEAWRAWDEYKDRCLYLDIETDGGKIGHSITVIGLYDGTVFRALIKDRDLGDFEEIIDQYDMVVTFFGTGFDVPMLQKKFREWRCDQIHLDLCFALKKLGYRGGLKKIERQLGIQRCDEADGLDGRDAIRLWRMWTRGDENALNQLVAYNREDVVNMERLAKITYDGLSQQAALF